MIQLFRTILRKCEETSATSQLTDTLNVLDIHADRFVAIAFAQSYRGPNWAKARIACRKLVQSVLRRDVQDVNRTIADLCRAIAKPTEPTAMLLPRVPKLIWKKVYNDIQADDPDGVEMIISSIALSAHLDTLSSKAFSTAKKVYSQASVAIARVNACIVTFREGFLDMVSNYTNHNSSSAVKELIRRPSMTKAVTFLMLCPDNDIQLAAQTLIGQAFDVDIRSECFRALLEHIPHSLSAIFEFIRTFVEYVTMAPEACNLSKALVQCLTDVIEVLCSSSDGLLQEDATSKRVGPDLPEFWSLMTQALALIFKGTPAWSLYFESEELIIWMRDALIFGREMLAQWRVFETAAVQASDTTSSSATTRRKLSQIGRKIVDDMQQVLRELARWLRLTDEELLHQSFALFHSLLGCFKDTHTAPDPDLIAKVTRHIEAARNPRNGLPQSRLDSARLSKLEDALEWFQEGDIEIISHTPALKKEARHTEELKHKLSSRVPDRTSRTGSTSAHPQLSKSTKSTSTKYEQKMSNMGAPAPPMPKFKDSQLSLAASIRLKKKRNQLVSSSAGEESGDEGSDNESRITDLGDMQRAHKIKKLPTGPRRIKLIDAPTTARNAALERVRQANAIQDARKLAFRLKPDVTALHRTVLSWTYDHPGAEPPTAKKLDLVRIPDQFIDHDQYRNVFEPLLLLECWAQIVQSREEPKDVYECKLTARSFMDDWLDVDILISEPVKRGWFLTDTDIVLLQHPAKKASILGKAMNFRTVPIGIQSVQATIRCFVGNGTDPGLQQGSTWRVSKIFR